MNKVFCFLTGGHRYRIADMKSTNDETWYYFENVCFKCGEIVHTKIPTTNIYKNKENGFYDSIETKTALYNLRDTVESIKTESQINSHEIEEDAKNDQEIV